MPGLIQTALPDPNKFFMAKSTGYDPSLGTVDLGQDTVSGQLDKILGQDNPYITRARASAAEAANSRGLINSTMGAQAGEAAAIDAALPIAQSNAATYSQQRLQNQAYQNQASQFGAQAENTANLANAGAGNQFGIIGTQLGADIGRIGVQGMQARQTQAEAATQAQELARVQGGIQTGLIGTTGAETRQTQAAAGDIQARIAELQAQLQTGLIGATGAQTRMTAAQEAGAQQELTKLQGQIQTGQIAATGEQTRANIVTQAQMTAGLNQQQIAAQATLEANRNQLQRDLQAATTQAQKDQLATEIQANAAAAEKVQALQREMQGAQTQAQKDLLATQISATQTLEMNRADLQKQLQASTIQADKDRLTTQITANQQAATALGTLQKELQGTENLSRRTMLYDQIAATAALENQRSQLQRDLQTADTQAKKDLVNRQIDANAEAATQTFLRSQELQKESSAQKIEQLTAAGQNDQALQTLKGSQAESLANIEGSYKTLIQSNASASALFQTAGKTINDILADPHTSVPQKQALVDAQTNVVTAALAIFGGTSNTDLIGLLDFNPSAEGTKGTATTVNYGDWVRDTSGGWKNQNTGAVATADQLPTLEKFAANKYGDAYASLIGQ